MSSALAVPPTRADALQGFRLILGREPADSAELDRILDGAESLAALRIRLLHSEEFRQRAPALLPALPMAPERLGIELEAGPEIRDAMLARTGEYWQAVGREAPHWSVLTQTRFRPEEIDEHKAAFYGSGEADAELLAAILGRHGTTPEEVGRCVEFGCGVGRVTLALARRFPRVNACDISTAHIAVGKEEAAARRIRNIGWHEATVAEPMPRGHWPLWFSRIVLQHNPPPVQAHLLRLAFRGLAGGGFAVFQLVTHRVGYRFSMEEYLARSGPPDMEMHVLPQDAVFRLAAEARLEVLDVREDLVVSADRSRWMSNLFVVRRPRRAG